MLMLIEKSWKNPIETVVNKTFLIDFKDYNPFGRDGFAETELTKFNF